MLFIVTYLSDEFMGFYYLSAIELYLRITQVGMCRALLSQDMGSFPSSCRVSPADPSGRYAWGLTLLEVVKT